MKTKNKTHVLNRLWGSAGDCFLLLVGLKFFEQLTWPWWTVFTPLLGMLVLTFTVALIAVCIEEVK